MYSSPPARSLSLKKVFVVMVVLVTVIHFCFNQQETNVINLSGGSVLYATPTTPHDTFFVEGIDPMDKRNAAMLGAHYERLFHKYQVEIRDQFLLSREFAAKPKIHNKEEIRCVGQIAPIEASMLYILIRETRPSNVLEIGCLCGSSTNWILKALELNNYGKLTTYDLHDYAATFIGKHDRWDFHVGDFLEHSNSTFANQFDLLFIDALHDNRFAEKYTSQLLDHMERDTPLVVHDIFSPFQNPLFRPCLRGLTLETFDEEVECINQVAIKFKREHLNRDFLYSEKQPGGEGPELMSWLARSGRSKGMVTFSPYAAPEFAKRMVEVFKEGSIPMGQINNPMAFFLLSGKKQPQATAF
jgi:predicted O-methyltransferase YrrM